jgi:hypothetical protein
LKIKYVLLEATGHLFNLYKLVPVMLIEYALHAYCDSTELAEVFDWLVVMPRAINEIFGVITTRLRFAQITIG